MTAAQTLKLFEIINKYFKNEADAKAFISEIEATINNKFEDSRNILATKEDIVRLEGRLDGKLTGLKGELTTALAESKVEIIKWMVGVSIAVVGLILAFAKLLP